MSAATRCRHSGGVWIARFASLGGFVWEIAASFMISRILRKEPNEILPPIGDD